MTFNVDAYLDRQRELFEMNAAAKYLAELLTRHEQLQSEYFEHLKSHPDFAGEYLLIQNRHARFDSDFKAGKDPYSLTRELFEIEAVNHRFTARIDASGQFSTITARMKELWDEYQDEITECGKLYFHDDFQKLFDKHYVEAQYQFNATSSIRASTPSGFRSALKTSP